jgi:hypothetical protein
VIGILAAGSADPLRGLPGVTDAGVPTGGFKALAFQAKGQQCGYLPDSDSTHYDRINVRQGRYDIWGPLHMVTKVDGSGAPLDPNVKKVIDFITAHGFTASDASAPDFETLIKGDVAAFTVPDCAMQVSRSAEVTTDQGGGMASYQPPVGCGCYFESLVAGGTPYSKYCQSCTSNASCPSAYPACNFGFCEVQ